MLYRMLEEHDILSFQNNLRLCIHDIRGLTKRSGNHLYWHNCHTSYVCFCLQIKNNSMKKLAANTLMEILPEEMQNMVKLILTYYQFMFGWVLKIVSYRIFVSFSIQFTDHEKVGWGPHNDPRLPNDCWTGILLLMYSCEWNIIVKKPTQKMAPEISYM